ncbi:MAG: GNAT family N-acetyltransferase [bacterium]|nr:GNAT family N-acetyltransferase [bacterium]
MRKAVEADIPVLVRRLAPSFAAQPLTEWILGRGERAVRKGERVLELDFRNALPYGLMYTTGGLDGAALWHPPDRRETLRGNLSRAARLILIIGPTARLPRQLAAFLRFGRLFPKTPHYYLSLLAVAPAAQGRGIGSALLAPVLGVCDARGVPAYTVTDYEPNIAFYSRLDFRVRDVFPAGGGGVRAWTLWREPRGGGGPRRGEGEQ